MKPKLDPVRSNEREQLREGRANRFPITHWDYHSVALGGHNGRGIKASPSFLNISRDYFKYEGPQTFAGEALFFGAIIAIAAWSIVEAVRAVMDLLGAFGAL